MSLLTLIPSSDSHENKPGYLYDQHEQLYDKLYDAIVVENHLYGIDMNHYLNVWILKGDYYDPKDTNPYCLKGVKVKKMIRIYNVILCLGFDDNLYYPECFDKSVANVFRYRNFESYDYKLLKLPSGNKVKFVQDNFIIDKAGNVFELGEYGDETNIIDTSSGSSFGNSVVKIKELVQIKERIGKIIGITHAGKYNYFVLSADGYLWYYEHSGRIDMIFDMIEEKKIVGNIFTHYERENTRKRRLKAKKIKLVDANDYLVWYRIGKRYHAYNFDNLINSWGRSLGFMTPNPPSEMTNYSNGIFNGENSAFKYEAERNEYIKLNTVGKHIIKMINKDCYLSSEGSERYTLKAPDVRPYIIDKHKYLYHHHDYFSEVEKYYLRDINVPRGMLLDYVSFSIRRDYGKDFTVYWYKYCLLRDGSVWQYVRGNLIPYNPSTDGYERKYIKISYEDYRLTLLCADGGYVTGGNYHPSTPGFKVKEMSGRYLVESDGKTWRLKDMARDKTDIILESDKEIRSINLHYGKEGMFDSHLQYLSERNVYDYSVRNKSKELVRENIRDYNYVLDHGDPNFKILWKYITTNNELYYNDELVAENVKDTLKYENTFIKLDGSVYEYNSKFLYKLEKDETLHFSGTPMESLSMVMKDYEKEVFPDVYKNPYFKVPEVKKIDKEKKMVKAREPSKKIAEKSSEISDGQCHGKTKSGTRCKNKTKGLYCHLHNK